MDHRYWQFVEVHHAHAPLHPSATQEAIKILTWACTGQQLDYALQFTTLMFVGLEHMIPSSTSFTPFTREECQDLMSVLRLLDGEFRAVLKPFIMV